MRTPIGVIHGPDDHPPASVTALNGFQHVGLVAIYLVYPVLVAEAAGADAATASAMVSLTLIALAIGAALQIFVNGPVGSGYLCHPVPTVVYLVPSLIAAKSGGLPLVFGMTLAAGLVEIGLSRLITRMRPYFPPEIAGVVVLLIGVATGIVGLRAIFGTDAGDSMPAPSAIGVAIAAVAVMIGLNVWARGLARMLCVLIGMALGYAVIVAGGLPGAPDLSRVAAEPLFAMPGLAHVGLAFDWSFAVPFGVAGVAAVLKAAGNITTLQRATDADWKRADMRSVSGGVLADGLGTVIAAGIGGYGLNSSTPAVALATATGVHSRRIAIPIVAGLLVLAFVPKIGLILYLMPKAVSGAALLFSGAFIFVNGLEMMTSRMIDARRGLVIGMGVLAGLAVDIFPGMVRALPEAARSVLGTSLVLGTVVALGLNLLFRIGATRRRVLVVRQAPADTQAIEDFMTVQGQEWGARRDVIERAAFNLAQAVETILAHDVAQGPLEVTASFDDFNVDLRITYRGSVLEFPTVRPSNEEILAVASGEARLAGYMLRRMADRVSATGRDGRCTVVMHFDH